MADPTYPTASAGILAASLGIASPGRVHYAGGGDWTTSAQEPVLRVLAEYLDRHSGERSGLADDLRSLLFKAATGAHEPEPYNLFASPLYGAPKLTIGARGFQENSVSPSGSGSDYLLLEAHRSDIASLARFSQRVDHAIFYLFVAADTRIERSDWFDAGVKVRRAPKSWQDSLARQCFAKWKTARNLLVHDWEITDRVEPLYRTAFWSLCELTPADSQLKILFDRDRVRACHELVKHVDAYADQLALATDLAQSMADTGEAKAETSDPAVLLGAIQSDLLDKAGERLTLTEAAQRLGVTRQALHKKIKTGAALGLMLGETFVVPAAQIVTSNGKTTIVANLRAVLAAFVGSGSGTWSALQYLIEPDPALGGAIPLDMLKSGEVSRVVDGARGYLGLDEG